MDSITDVKMKCPQCCLITTAGLAEPDIDGDGSLGCPRCLSVENKKVVLCELVPKKLQFTADVLWEDPYEGDINGAVMQLQKMMQYLLDKDVNGN